jgi:MFS family permease
MTNEVLTAEAPTPAADLAKRHPRAIATLAALLLLTILSYADRMIIVLLVDPIKRDLLLDDVQISLLQGLAFALCFGLASLPLGWAADRYSRRWVIYAGVTIWSLATAASGVAVNFEQMFAARFLVGVGEAALAPAAFALLPDLFPRRQVALATGVLTAGAAVGGGGAILIGGFLVSWAQHAGDVQLPLIGAVAPWQLVFLSLGLPGVLLAFLAFVAPASTVPRHVEAAAAPVDNRALLSWLRVHWAFVLGLAFGASALGALAYGLTNWTPAYLSRTLGLEIHEFHIPLGIVQLTAGICGFVGSGWVIDRLSARSDNASHLYLIAAAAIAAVAAVGAFVVAKDAFTAITFVGIYHLCAPFTTALVTVLQKAAPRAFRGQAIALVIMVTTLLGMIVGPSSVAILTEHVFEDQKAVGKSIAVLAVISCSLAILCLTLTFRAAGRAIAETVATESEPRHAAG